MRLSKVRTITGQALLPSHPTVIVTSGIGYSIVPIRDAAPGSIEIIELRP